MQIEMQVYDQLGILLTRQYLNAVIEEGKCSKMVSNKNVTNVTVTIFSSLCYIRV